METTEYTINIYNKYIQQSIIEEEEKREKHNIFTGILIDGLLYMRKSKHHELGSYKILTGFHQSNNNNNNTFREKYL